MSDKFHFKTFTCRLLEILLTACLFQYNLHIEQLIDSVLNSLLPGTVSVECTREF